MVVPPRVIGRYALHDEMAAGGMATVHFGRLLGPVGFSRTVAIKRLHAQFAKDPEFVAMFLDEARLAARVRHPNVVQTLDVVATDGEIFLVMDYVQGESLARLTRGRQAPPRILASIMCGVLHGLHAAHEATNEQGEPLDIVHRDVSPQNILVGVDGIARVLDFGVAKAHGRAQSTREGQLKGKIPYMAPEQLRGAVTRRTDIYAAAIVTWEALVGKRLFGGGDEMETFARVVAGATVPPSKAGPDVSAAFDDVVMRGLHVDDTKRWGTAREMALALEACVGVASPSEVGDWVETSARAALSRRSQTITGIESQPQIVPPEALTITEGSGAPARPAEPATATPLSQDPSSISVAGPVGATSRSPLRALLVAAVVAVPVLAAGVYFLVRAPAPASTASGSNAPMLAATATSAAPVLAESPPPPTQSAAPPPAVPAGGTAGGTAVVPAGGTAGSGRANVAPADPRTAAPTAPHPPAKPRPTGCDPPYTTDAQGHHHYKMECL